MNIYLRFEIHFQGGRKPENNGNLSWDHVEYVFFMPPKTFTWFHLLVIPL
jgi:hypothetical protein